MQSNETVYEPLKWIVVFTALLGGLFLGGCDRRQQSQQPAVPEVATVTVQPQELVLTTELPGRTCAYLVAEIRPQVNGIIKDRLFTEGSDVKAGQILYQIDPAPFQAALDSARASLLKSEANLPAVRLKAERSKQLLEAKAVSQQDFDDKDAALKQAEADVAYWKAAVETARINLDYTHICAPISGRIGKSNVTTGALVTAHQAVPMATIQEIDPIYVDVAQSTTELLRLKRNFQRGLLKNNGENQRTVKLLLDDGRPYPLEGTLQFRDVTVDPTTGSVILRIVFSNPKHVLLPGMFVRATVVEGTADQAILVPQQGVSRDPKGNPIALIVDADGKVQQKKLKLDRPIGDKWLVSSGLAPGDNLIVEGSLKVRPGATVKSVPFLDGQKAVKTPEDTHTASKESN
ncbi:efflux RND transporter periplasmic adaptor subunit [Desulfomonile tiedjei]|uniref:RND family efflux transporter, MFP subunit n=1 Tax=Desulfomonile tiedjei (strain ATCC 49306 / DSM 6799 / DCB-1) TaxID=706587 RepID=I4C0S4_DESTA|nr:efflux RND transporter periplasmic adaptor subunit [Desulfomonile tiedjei]AFM23165.1 RND family efflux transporter, MFP subunit [Desulfomonile tiedjei DSM 6799]